MGLFEKREKRRHPRVQSYHLARCEFPARPLSIQLTNLVNLSEGGLQFVCDNLFRLAEEIRMTINLAEMGKEIPVWAKVVWVRKDPKGSDNRSCHVGVSFTRISESDRQVIREFVGELGNGSL